MSQNQEPAVGLTAEVMQKLEGGKRVQSRGRITNTFTYVLASAAVLVGTFSAGAWVGRDNAPAAAAATTGGAAAALAGASGATGGFAGRNGGAGFSGASGFTGVPGGAAGAGGTTGTVKLIDGSNVYITTAQGTTVKVTTNPQSVVSVSKQGTVADLAVGETIIVQGDAATDGTIAATTIRSGAAGLGGATRGGGANAGAATASGATAGR